MSITIPRVDIHAIAARYDDSFSLDTDPPAEYVRQVAKEYRENADYADSEAERNSLLGEALALDGLVDRVENARDEHCIAYSEDPDTGRCECGHPYDAHGGGPGQCEAPLTAGTAR